jgi:hypothetical protein
MNKSCRDLRQCDEFVEGVKCSFNHDGYAVYTISKSVMEQLAQKWGIGLTSETRIKWAYDVVEGTDADRKRKFRLDAVPSDGHRHKYAVVIQGEKSGSGTIQFQKSDFKFKFMRPRIAAIKVFEDGEVMYLEWPHNARLKEEVPMRPTYNETTVSSQSEEDDEIMPDHDQTKFQMFDAMRKIVKGQDKQRALEACDMIIDELEGR